MAKKGFKRPNQTFKKIGTIEPRTKRPLPDPQFDSPGFDELIRNRGLRWRHEKAVICPNLEDLDAQRHNPNCLDCDRGYFFFGACEVIGMFYQNKLEQMYEAHGIWDVGQAVVTFQAYQAGSNGEPGEGGAVDFQIGDRITCLDYTFTWYEMIEHNASTGIDRLRYPACQVEIIRDSKKEYFEGRHFSITSNGMIKWMGRDRPGYNAPIERGGIYSIRYTAKPVFFVTQILHEIRATKGINRATKELVAVRLPQQVLLRRDYLVNHPGDDTGQKDVLSPRMNTSSPS